MNSLRSAARFVVLWSAALAGCATTGSLDSAADRLDRSAQHFYEDVRAHAGPGHTANDAGRLAEATQDFSRAVDRSRSREDLRFAFERVSQRYHHLRGQVERRGSPYHHDALAFERVTEAYLDVDRALNHPGSRYHE
jgi:hypothetical protein